MKIESVNSSQFVSPVKTEALQNKQSNTFKIFEVNKLNQENDATVKIEEQNQKLESNSVPDKSETPLKEISFIDNGIKSIPQKPEVYQEPVKPLEAQNAANNAQIKLNENNKAVNAIQVKVQNAYGQGNLQQAVSVGSKVNTNI